VVFLCFTLLIETREAKQQKFKKENRLKDLGHHTATKELAEGRTKQRKEKRKTQDDKQTSILQRQPYSGAIMYLNRMGCSSLTVRRHLNIQYSHHHSHHISSIYLIYPKATFYYITGPEMI